MLASSTIVPKNYQNNIPNCVVALNMANRMGADALMVMQNLYIVHGNPTWSSQFLIATFNVSGRFSVIRYEFNDKKGTDAWSCKAWAIEKATGERLEGAEITIELAKKEGWFSKTGSKWQTMPQQMLMYRAAAWFVRAFAPEIAMGLHTTEEAHDVYELAPQVDGSFAITSDDIKPVSAAKTEILPVTEPTPPAVAKPAPPVPRGAPPVPEVNTTVINTVAASLITCPDTGKAVDEIDCASKPCRSGCPEFGF